MKLIITGETCHLRLDKAISLLDNTISRSKIQKLIDSGNVLVNGQAVKSSYKTNIDDEVIYENADVNVSTLKEEDLPINIVYEDDNYAIINKPKGMVVHPGNGNHEHTLANALLHHFKSLSSNNGEFRPGIVHRIDKDTGGLLVVAKNDNAHQFFADELKEHKIVRKYYALVQGEIREEKGKIIAPIGRDKTNRLKMAVDLSDGKEAVTHFSVIKRYNGYTLVECVLETGRTHQIRVHMNYIGYPIVGDPLYGKNNRNLYKDGQLLFAYHLTLKDPISKEKREYEVSLPDYFNSVLLNLKVKIKL